MKNLLDRKYSYISRFRVKNLSYISRFRVRKISDTLIYA